MDNLVKLLFSKALQHLPVALMAEQVREAGFDGVDLTARPGGHVEPARVQTDMPAAVADCQNAGAPVGMLTTDITSPDQDDAERLFAAAADAGIRYLKLGYHRYHYGRYRQSLDIMRRDGDGFEALAKRFGVCACHHIHSGNFMTRSAFTVAQILEGHDPDHLAAYIDPCHMWIEGTLQNWRMGMEVLRGKIRLVAIKDFQYRAAPQRLSEGFTYPLYVPLRQGVVAWEQVMRILLHDQGYHGPLSFHMEYKNAAEDQKVAAVIDDRAYLDEVIQRLG